jgi:hypothetical protein
MFEFKLKKVRFKSETINFGHHNQKITLNKMEMKSKQLLLVFLALIIIPAFQCSTAESKKTEPSKPEILIETEFGNIKLVLYDETPEHRDNFIRLIETGFYKDLLFHRVIPSFMIQGGDPNFEMLSPERSLAPVAPITQFRQKYTHIFFTKREHLQLPDWEITLTPKKDLPDPSFILFREWF